MEKRYISTYILKFLIIALISLLFVFILTKKEKAALALSMTFVILPICWILFKQIDEKKFMLFFIFIYPLLPGLWGIELSATLPVIKGHRVAVMVLFFYMIRNGIFTKYFSDFFKANIFSYAIFFISISLFLTSFFSENVATSLYFAFSFIFEFVILAVIVYSAFKDKKDIDALVSIMCASAVILGVIGYIEKFTEFNIYSLFGSFRDVASFNYQIREGSIRITGPFNHSIILGTYFALHLPLFLYKYRNNSVLLYGSILFFVPVTLMTQSRSGIIGIFLVLIFYFIVLDRKRLTVILFFSIPFLIIKIDSILNFILMLDPTGSSSESYANSSSERVRQFNFFIEYVKKNFLIGYGQGFTPALMRGRWDGSEGNYQTTIDNFYLLYTLQYGILGLTTWLYLMLISILRPIRIYGKKIFAEPLLALSIFNIIVFCIINLVAGLWSYHFIFWIYIGIIMRFIIIKRDEDNT